MERRLAAILSANLAGHSRLMDEDEVGTLVALRRFRENLLEPALADHRGLVIERMDGRWLVEFSSVSDAVKAAILIQDGLVNDETIRLRVGIHIGEIIHRDEAITGEDVNIAARMREWSELGGIFVSEAAHHSLDAKLSEAFVEFGTRKFKYISRPVTAYRWSFSEETPTQSVESSGRLNELTGTVSSATLAERSGIGQREELPIPFLQLDSDDQIAIVLEKLAALWFVRIVARFMVLSVLNLSSYVVEGVRLLVTPVLFTMSQHPGILYGTLIFLSIALSFIYFDFTYGEVYYGGSLFQDVVHAVRRDARE